MDTTNRRGRKKDEKDGSSPSVRRNRAPGDGTKGLDLAKFINSDAGKAAVQRRLSENYLNTPDIRPGGTNNAATPGLDPSDEDVQAALSYISEKNSLMGWNEMERFGGRSPSAGEMGMGGGVAGGETARDMALEGGKQQSALPDFIRNTPLGRQIERDGWQMSPEDERMLRVLIADKLQEENGLTASHPMFGGSSIA